MKEGAIVIDVGINSVQDNSKPKGYRLVGDVDFHNVKEVASVVTPVPGEYFVSECVSECAMQVALDQ